jgi:DNA-binding response OmpR family regulator
MLVLSSAANFMETAMTSEKVHRLAHLANQLAETIMTAAIGVEELRAIIRAEPGDDGHVRRGRSNDGSLSNSPVAGERPIVDHSTLTVTWAGKSCHLGYTILFRLADRISRRPNQYVTAEQLLREVWDDGLRSPDTIRSTVRRLRDRLSHAGMQDLAAAIRGRGGRYGLILNDGE